MSNERINSKLEDFKLAYDFAQNANFLRNQIIFFKQTNDESTISENDQNNLAVLEDSFYSNLNSANRLFPGREIEYVKSEFDDFEFAKKFMTEKQQAKVPLIRQQLIARFGHDISPELAIKSFPLIMSQDAEGNRVFNLVSMRPIKAMKAFRYTPYDAERLISGDMPNKIFASKYQISINAEGQTYNAATGMTAELFSEMHRRSKILKKKTFHDKVHPVLLLGSPFGYSGRKPLAVIDSRGKLSIIENYNSGDSSNADRDLFIFNIKNFHLHPTVLID